MKTALITGSSSGIGKGLALRLAKDGWKTLIHGRRKIPIEETVAAIKTAGGVAVGRSADMADMAEVAELSDWAMSEGDLHAVIHCAAKFTYGPVSTDRFEDWDLTIDSVLRATIRLTAHTLPSIRQNNGCYVYICGPTSWLGWKNHAIHCATRHAQAGFAKALFEDVREDGVGVTLVHPGFVDTPAVSGEGLERSKMIQIDDISEMIATAINLPNTACVAEFTLRPQQSPYVR